MDRASALAALILLGAVTALGGPHPGAQSAPWPKYLPAKERKGVFGNSTSVAGITYAVWVTELQARAIVSDITDKERLSASESEERFAALRAPQAYSFLIGVPGASARPGSPFMPNRLFLQRRSEPGVFSRGATASEPLSLMVDGRLVEDLYLVRFPRTTAEGSALVTGESDVVQVLYTVGDEEIVLNFKISDLLKRKAIGSLPDL